MAKRRADSKLPAPFLKRLTLRKDRISDQSRYPFNLPWLAQDDFEICFTSPVTIIVGENGTGKSTLIEGIASLCGYDEAGGGKGYMPVDHSKAIDESGSVLAETLVGAWLPRVTQGWFFKAETFFSVSRYLDVSALEAGAAPPDFLSWSHGEGFVRFFEERMSRQGIYFMDEPESALSPKRQLELLRVLDAIQRSAKSQVIMATHSPILMALPQATLLEITHRGLVAIDVRDTQHFKLYQKFMADPEGFVLNALEEKASE